jgi:hypothetical protein
MNQGTRVLPPSADSLLGLPESRLALHSRAPKRRLTGETLARDPGFADGSTSC